MPSFVDWRWTDMRPWRIRLDRDVLHAQAFGRWLYLQIGDTALSCGTHMPAGLRLVWRPDGKRMAFRRFR